MAKTPKTAKRTPSAAFMKPVTPDDMLAKVVGDKLYLDGARID